MANYGVAFSGKLTTTEISSGPVELFEKEATYDLDSLRKPGIELLPLIRTLELGHTLLDTEQFEELQEAGAKATIIEVDEFGSGRQKNSHGLIFGQMAMSSLFDLEKQVFIAVKPFDTVKDAAREYAFSEYLNGLTRSNGNRLTFNPLGFHRFEDNGQFALITELEESVISYDNTFWDPNVEPTSAQVERALSRCAFGLAKLHLYGISHGDAQVKNMAADNSGIRFVDLESADLLPRANGALEPYSAKYEMSRDIARFVGSLNSGLDSEPIDYSDQAIAAFDEHYIHVLHHPSSNIPDEAILTREEIKDIVYQN